MRGALGSVNQLVICLGILGALLVNVVYPPTAWRAMLWLSAVPAIVLGIGALPTCTICAWGLWCGSLSEPASGLCMIVKVEHLPHLCSRNRGFTDLGLSIALPYLMTGRTRPNAASFVVQGCL